jgi:hypothetical protein
VEVVEGGQLVCCWLDGVFDLLQELTRLAYASVDRLWSDVEESGDGDLGQGEAVMQSCPVGP